MHCVSVTAPAYDIKNFQNFYFKNLEHFHENFYLLQFPTLFCPPSLPPSLPLLPPPPPPPPLLPTGLRRQFTTHLEELGLKEFEQYNELSASEPMIRAILTAGLNKNVMKMAKMLESGGHRGNTNQPARKRVRNGFKTM